MEVISPLKHRQSIMMSTNFNYIDFYSLLLQGVVDSTGLFLSIAKGFLGSLHDARMLQLTDFIGLPKMKRFS